MASSPFRRRKAAKAVRNLAIAEAALALAKDRLAPVDRRLASGPRGKLLLIGGAVAAVGAAALLKRDKVAGLLPVALRRRRSRRAAPRRRSRRTTTRPGPSANTATPVPAPDPHDEPAPRADRRAGRGGRRRGRGRRDRRQPERLRRRRAGRARRRGAPPAGRGRRGRVRGPGAGRGRARRQRHLPRRRAERRRAPDRGDDRAGRPADAGETPEPLASEDRPEPGRRGAAARPGHLPAADAGARAAAGRRGARAGRGAAPAEAAEPRRASARRRHAGRHARRRHLRPPVRRARRGPSRGRGRRAADRGRRRPTGGAGGAQGRRDDAGGDDWRTWSGRARSTRSARVRLGFAVKVLGDGGLPSHDARRWQSGPHLRWSLAALARDRRLLRAPRHRHVPHDASSLAPYATHPDLPQFHGQVGRVPRRARGARRARRAPADIRLSTHPGQYVVLNSEDPAIRAAAARDVELQAALLDAMGAGPEAVCVLHVGGAGGRRRGGPGPLRGRPRDALGPRARERLVIENDDRTLRARPRAGAAPPHRACKVVWDILHHHCNDPDGIPDREALELALATWPAGVHAEDPLLLAARPRWRSAGDTCGRRVERSWVLPQLRAHADMIDPIGFEHFVRETAAGLELRRDARGQGQGPRAAAAARAAGRRAASTCRQAPA